MNNWKYAFDCRNCHNCQYVKDSVRDGYYCMVTVNALTAGLKDDHIHADDDYVVRCDNYSPMQVSFDLLVKEVEE